VTKRYHRHRAFYLAIGCGVPVAALAAFFLTPWQALEIGTVVFFISYLTLSLRKLPLLTAKHLRAHADENDAPVLVLYEHEEEVARLGRRLVALAREAHVVAR